MKALVLLGMVLVLASSCRRYETCATYAKDDNEKSHAENLTKTVRDN